MQMLADREAHRGAAAHGENRASNPVEETAAAGVESVFDYFKSHPDPADRLAAIQELIRTQGWAPVPEKPLVPRAVLPEPPAPRPPSPPPPPARDVAARGRPGGSGPAPPPIRVVPATPVTPFTLAGRWVLVSANGGTGRGTGRHGLATMNRIKLYRADGTWDVTERSAPEDGSVITHYGGTYAVAGASGYRETVTYGSTALNTELAGTAGISGETLVLQFSNGAFETWMRTGR
jgi:hypothetical protein